MSSHRAAKLYNVIYPASPPILLVFALYVHEDLGSYPGESVTLKKGEMTLEHGKFNHWLELLLLVPPNSLQLKTVPMMEYILEAGLPISVQH